MFKYLTDEEINKIIAEAESNKDFMEDNIVHFGRFYYSVIKVSKVHALILIEGNENTGFRHINQRHDYFHSRSNWKSGKLGSGSKFSSSTLGYFDYLRIADKIYETKIIIEKDRKNNDYEKYEAGLEIGQKYSVYRLLVYKGTRIIHNLFPLEDVSVWKRPKNFNLIRGTSKSIDYKNALQQFTISYKNKKEIIYNINITKNFFLKIEFIEIVDIMNDKVFFKQERILEQSFSYQVFMVMNYFDSDLTFWEQEILNYKNS